MTGARTPRGARPQCPRCPSRDVLAIIYGLLREPIPGAIPGGCAYSSDSPLWKCQTCGAAWRDRDERGRFATATETRAQFEEIVGDIVGSLGGTLIRPDGDIIY